MEGVNVGSALDQQTDDFRRTADDRSVQRRTPSAVAAIHEAWIGVEQCTDLPQIA